MENINEMVLVFVSSLAAAISFAIFALPFLEGTEKKERYKSVIEKRRRDLFAQAKESGGRPQNKNPSLSASESLAMTFKVQEMLGEMGESVRDQLLQAGIRNPKAPIKFMMARVGIPIFLILMALMIMGGMDKSPEPIMQMGILFGAMIFGYFLPSILVKNQADKRVQEINLTFPDALDMMLICVQGGMGLEQTVDRIADEIVEHSPILAEELGILSAEMAMLNDRRAALQDFARRVGSGAGKSFATALIQAEQYGTSVSNALKVMSEELRDLRMQAAEQKAASLPPKLTVPMIGFFLPVLFVVILGPAIIQAMDM